MKKKQDETTTITETKDVTEHKTLTAEEERILRMRSGATVEGDAKLASKVDDVQTEHQADVRARLALMEQEILRTLTEHPELRHDRKQRIVDALRDQTDD
ncbi:MAG: hypothetical protein VX589_12390 [Myxococcota bacterium]|nr:hypothetical protein [Myxococcota bacterium]